MKICPVCNDSFADELNFCDVDGTRLAREDSTQERNKWWSLLGAGLLVAAVLISAASIIFLPKARVSPPLVNSEPQPNPVATTAPSVDSGANVASSAASPETEQTPADAVAAEVKKKDKELATDDVGDASPDPKAAALAAEGGGKDSAANDAKSNESAVPKPEPTLPISSVSDPRTAEPAPKPPQTPTELKKDHQSQPVSAKSTEKDQNAKKKTDDKDKKKGGFLRVFKKIFGKD